MTSYRSIRLYLCAKGHLSSNVQPMPGHGDGPPFHCCYPCMAKIVSEADYSKMSRTRKPRRR